jgi:hypothetical protein
MIRYGSPAPFYPRHRATHRKGSTSRPAFTVPVMLDVDEFLPITPKQAAVLYPYLALEGRHIAASPREEVRVKPANVCEGNHCAGRGYAHWHRNGIGVYHR